MRLSQGWNLRPAAKESDILAVDKDSNFVIIELKVSRGYEKVIGQILRYRAWVRKNLAGEQGIRGVIIAKVITDDLKLAASATKDIELFEYDLTGTLRAADDALACRWVRPEECRHLPLTAGTEALLQELHFLPPEQESRRLSP